MRIVSTWIDEEVKLLGGRHDRVFLGGMSQGCCIALASFLLYKRGRLGGVVGTGGAHKTKIDYKAEVDLPLKR